jgi:uncharacterized protein UPF0547
VADPGTDINQIFTVAATPESLSQAFIAASSASSDYQVTAAAQGSIVLTRRYIPTWAIVVAVLGAFFFLIGLLALLYKETETVAITITPVPGGARVSITGRCTAEMATRLNAVISSTSPLEAEAEPAAVAQGEQPTKTCPQCAEQVKVAAQVCRFCGYEFATTSESAPEVFEPPAEGA